MRNAAPLLQRLENGQDLPAPLLHRDALAGLQDTGDVLVEAAARDMGHAMDVAVPDDVQHFFHIDVRRGQQHLAEHPAVQFRPPLLQGKTRISHNLAHEAEAVGVHTARRNAHQHVAHFYFRTINEFAFLHDAGRKARDVVLAVRIHARHLGGLAADQRTARLPAAFRHTGHDGLHLFGDVVAQGHVVQEKERFRALRQHVVDAHGHGIDADGVVLVHRKRDLEFGAHAVGAAHQHRLLVAERSEVEHAAERADAAHPAGTLRRCHMLLDAPHHFVSCFQAYACLFIVDCHYFFLK